jgi:AcrR family transcriptional regulator
VAKPDRRVERTRQTLLAAFRDLMLAHGYDGLTVREIIEHANIGRSTFYDHFDGLDDIFRESISPLLSVLADAVAPAQTVALSRVIGHFWENRRLSRVMFAGPTRPLMTGFLAELIHERLAATPRRRRAIPLIPLPLIAAHLAEAQLGLLAAWLGGKAPCTADAIAAALHRSAAASVGAFVDYRPSTSSG